METFLTGQVVEESKRKARRRTWVFRGILLAGLGLFILLCLLTRTGNARIMLYLGWGVLLLCGWAATAWWMFLLEPARAEASHREGLLRAGEPEVREGTLQIDPESFRIPRSVRIRKAMLDTGEETLSLNLGESLWSRAPGNGARVRVQVARKFIVGMEVLSPGAETLRRPSRVKKVARGLGRLFPAAVIWAMAALMLGGFVFNQITDTDGANKIAIYALCELRDAPELAEQLEAGLNGAVRMVKIHSFDYAMFGSEALRSADLYLLPDSRRSEYADWLAPEADGSVPDGLLLYDPETGAAVAARYFCYGEAGTAEEPWRLYLGAGSPHLEDGLARRAAELLAAVP